MLVLGPALAIGASTLIYNFGLLDLNAAITLGIALWTALWWIFEAVPIPVASLLPLSLLPLFGILSPKVVGEKYGHPLVLLLLGGFLLSKAMEKSGAHRRIALMMVNACPSGEKFLNPRVYDGYGISEYVDLKHSNHFNDASHGTCCNSG